MKKCLIWDLDNTLWDGVCLEGEVELKPKIAGIIEELDQRGILHSVASRGDEEVALSKLQEFKLASYFLKPKINWLPKPTNILDISRELDISLDAIAFIDDDPFELEQVASLLPAVMTVHAEQVLDLPDLGGFNQVDVTPESRRRRELYQAEELRESAAAGYPSREAFLHSCEMQMKVHPMTEDDVPRVLELISRTHQLNTTGWLFSRDEIRSLVENQSDRKIDIVEPDLNQQEFSLNRESLVMGGGIITVAELCDRFGAYGTIGVSIVQTTPESWSLCYLAMSCRILGRGMEKAFLHSLLMDARDAGYGYADAMYRATGRNRQMRVLYQMAGFTNAGTLPDGESMVFRLDLDSIPAPPSWVTVS
ncbi:HAD-IIIC family phosphatase [Gemmatimonadota bacterium]